MRVFVASWFFPPATSSEGIVTYKLLRNSEHTFDVCSSRSDLWGYKHELPLQADNIRVIAIQTDEVDEWVERAIELFEKNHAENPYDAIMTRSMPPESILVGEAAKKAHPELPWIASLADPIACNPYQIKDLVLDNERMDDEEKARLVNALSNGFGIEATDDPAAAYLRSMKEIEDKAVNGADALVFPCDTLKSHVLGTRQRKHAIAIPHSFDLELVGDEERAGQGQAEQNGIVTFTFLGHTDHLRSLNPLVLALHHIQKTNAPMLDRIRIRCIGNVPGETRDLIYNFHLHNIISIEPSVDYLTSLSIMNESPWLVHVDASFDTLEDTGGSIFFAGKIADYFGTNSPVLGITGHGSPAQTMIKRAGGACVDPREIPSLAETLIGIAEGSVAPRINRAYRDRFAAKNAALVFDRLVAYLTSEPAPFFREAWPAAEPSSDEKLVSICIPAYNVECYLDRCLLSLMSCEHSALFDIIVVNDGSKDGTLEIARAYEERYPGIVRAIDKPNGGHGSTINAALAQARGTYFRVIDGDDWVDVKSFDELVGNMLEKDIDADLISSNYYQVFFEDGHTYAWEKKGSSEYYETYDFATSDFTMEYFAMASAMFKTEVMRSADFALQEHTFYVDVEYLLFPIPYTKTVLFAPEYVYRYAVGNADQSINPSTFTNRYDHHDRVIRRMLAYYKEHEPTMGEGQRSYMRSLFERHLLQSHYLLSLVWDPDRERGLERARDFDAFLEACDPDLWKAVRTSYPAVRTARAKRFDPNRIAKPESIEDGGRTPHAIAGRCLRRLKNTRVADALAANEGIRNAYRKIIGR
ncbi:glycosyltransferase [Eggerthella lenta]|uniref:Glycosyltransferase n=1 Tax=Eggerthella lenta TaxID=84112 RepID=A0A5C5BTW5_EGGLN|nr:glycosyltransferase [Eggerthella lenta]TNU89933.1 glycosyltransferase [Eggerthella lenta]